MKVRINALEGIVSRQKNMLLRRRGRKNRSRKPFSALIPRQRSKKVDQFKSLIKSDMSYQGF